jgi:hypothetical protein
MAYPCRQLFQEFAPIDLLVDTHPRATLRTVGRRIVGGPQRGDQRFGNQSFASLNARPLASLARARPAIVTRPLFVIHAKGFPNER